MASNHNKGQEPENSLPKEYSPEQVQKAKNFLWDYMSNINQSLIVELSDTDKEMRNGLYVKRIVAGLELTGNGIRTREEMIIGVEYMRSPSPL